MTRDDIRARLRETMQASSEADVDWDSVGEDSEIAALGFDSLSVLDLVYDIQQAFDLEFDAEELASVTKVGDLVDFLQARLG